MRFEKKVVMNNGVHTLTIPLDLVKYLGINKDSVLILQDENGKYGKYFSVWIKERR